MKIPQLADDAPLTGEQKQWLNGFFAGLHSRLIAQRRGAANDAARAAGKPVTILYGSQTGNAESVAVEAGQAANANGLAAHVSAMDQVNAAALSDVETLLVITSTYGDGEMPDNAHMPWQAVSDNTAVRMDHTRFAALGLGDTNYSFSDK